MTKTQGNYTDFVTFSRASGGTALRKISYGSELVTNGDFATGDLTGWTDASTAPATATVVDYALQLVSDGVARARVRGTYGTISGKVYWVSFDVVSGSVEFNCGTTSAGTEYFGGSTFTAGTHARAIFATSSNLYIQAHKGIAGTGVIDNISIKEVLFDRADGTLQLFNHPTNVPRVEYDASGNLKGLLIEEARTNLILNSATPAIGFFESTGGDIPSVSTTMLGLNARSFTRTNTSFADVSPAANTYAVTAGLSYTFSFYALSPTAPTIKPAVRDLTNLAWVIGHTATNTTTALTNTPTRFSYTFTAPAGCASVSVHFHYGVGNAVGDTFVFTAPQLEVGAFPTSYIPTTGATATRAADICSMATSAFGYNQGAGTIVVDVADLQFGATGYPRVLEIGNSSNGGERINIYVYSALQNYRTSLNTANVVQGIIAYASSITSPLAPSKAALAYKTNDIAAAYGGVLKGTDSTADITGTTYSRATLKIGGATTSTTDQLNGHIKSIRYYPRRLTNAQLQALTA